MKKIIKNIITIIGMAMFILGVSSADSECLIFPIGMTLAGISILYWLYGDWRTESEEADE